MFKQVNNKMIDVLYKKNNKTNYSMQCNFMPKMMWATEKREAKVKISRKYTKLQSINC